MLCSSLSLISSSFRFMILLQSKSQIPWVLLVALLAHGLQIHFIELSLDGHLLVTGGAGKVLGLPSLVEGSEDIPGDDGVADVAEVPEQLVVVGLTVGQTLPLVMPR